MYIISLLAGLVLILVGADRLTDGAAEVAKRLHISEFVVGLTVIAIGTSMPELVVSLLSAIGGQSGMAVGNVVGSNTFNIFMVVGLCALISPIPLSRNNIRIDIPVCMAVSLLFVACGCYGSIGRPAGIAMTVLYAALMWYTVRSSRPEAEKQAAQAAHGGPSGDDTSKRRSSWMTAVMITGGLCALAGGGEMFVHGATELARRLGVPESVIAITLVAGGTSLPELASSVVSLLKGRGGMALGNVIGSNTANILLVLGVSASARPLTFSAISDVDLGIVLAGAVLLFVSAFTFRRRAIDRWEGGIFITLYIAYIVWLIRNAA